MASDRLMIRSSRQTYGLVAAVVVVLLLAGLLVPLAFGDPDSEIATSGGSGPAPIGELGTVPTGDSGVSTPATSTVPTTGPGPSTTVAAGPTTTATPGPGPAGDAPPDEAPAPPAGAQLTASDAGVTETTIKIGVVLLDLEAVEPLGLGLENYSVDAQRKVFQTYIDDINGRGGINGRQVQAVYVRNDPLDAGAARARCVQLAKDHQVFAVLGFVTEETTCLVREQRRPTVAYTNYPSADYTQSGHYLITPQPSAERVAANWAGALDQLGSLEGRTIGIVAGEADAEAVPADALQATLKQLGYDVAYRARISEDADTGMSQLPIEVQRMRNAGVDTVFFPTNFFTARTWVENAESQGWVPQYLTSDVGALASDDLVEEMPASFDGAIGIANAGGGLGARSVRAGEPERPENTECRDVYNQSADGPDYEYGEMSPISNACPIVQIFERAAAAAGTTLTRDGFVAAVQTLGAIPLPTYPGGTFAAGKSDYNDTVQPLRWKASCRCYDIAGPLMSGRF